jgi:hypothetical protein
MNIHHNAAHGLNSSGHTRTMNGMKKIFTPIMLLICGCSTAKFAPYQGSEIILGKGGEMHPVDGIEFWTNGDPARKYKILGTLEEEKSKHLSAFDSEFVRDSDSGDHDSKIARTVRKNGGNGVIFISKPAGADKPANVDSSMNVDEDADPAARLRHHKHPRFTMVVIRYVD